MNEKRLALYAVGFLVAANLVLFILTMNCLFLGPIHHHWVLPFETLCLGVQYVFWSRNGSLHQLHPSAYRGGKVALAFLLVLTCVIGAVRYETIFTCVENCRYKLFAAWIFTALAFRLGIFKGK
jgi:hypothetical protein